MALHSTWRPLKNRYDWAIQAVKTERSRNWDVPLPLQTRIAYKRGNSVLPRAHMTNEKTKNPFVVWQTTNFFKFFDILNFFTNFLNCARALTLLPYTEHSPLSNCWIPPISHQDSRPFLGFQTEGRVGNAVLDAVLESLGKQILHQNLVKFAGSLCSPEVFPGPSPLHILRPFAITTGNLYIVSGAHNKSQIRACRRSYGP